jgi:sugar phosphate isomerase/epimerase
MIQYGICGNPDIASMAVQAGFDYFEMTVGALLKPRADEAAFNAVLTQVQATGLPCPVVNVFVPADLKITGPTVNLSLLETYVTIACRRAERAGVRMIVFGSGGARRIPDGFDRPAAWRQLVAFCRMLAPIAVAHGVTIAVEPLNKNECNVLNTVGECAQLVREVGQPGIRLLVDAFHLLKDGDSIADIVANGDILVHVHVATHPGRLAPGMEVCDLGPFFSALVRSGYDGRISIESNLPERVEDLKTSLDIMKKAGRL